MHTPPLLPFIIDQHQPTISLLPHPPPTQTQIQKPIRATTMTKSIQTKQMKGSPIPASDDKPGAETVSPTPPTPPATAEPKSTPPSKPLSKSMNMVSDSRSFQFTHPLTHTPPPPPLQKSTSSTQTTSQPTAIKKTPSTTSPNIIPLSSSDSKLSAQQKSLLKLQQTTLPPALTVDDETEVSRAATVPPPLQKSTSSAPTTPQTTANKKTPSKTSPNIIPLSSSDAKLSAQQKSLLKLQKSTPPPAVTVIDTEVSKSVTLRKDSALKQKLDLTKDSDANASLCKISIPAGENVKAKVRKILILPLLPLKYF